MQKTPTLVNRYKIKAIFGLDKSTLMNLGINCCKNTVYAKKFSVINCIYSLSTTFITAQFKSSKSGLISGLLLKINE